MCSNISITQFLLIYNILFYKGRGQLSVDDLSIVQIDLWKVRSKWRNLGIQLGTKIDDLEAIHKEHGNAPDSCFTDSIICWLRQSSSPRTWMAIIKALRSPTVEFYNLAEELERKYLQSSSINNLDELDIKFPHIDEVSMDEQQRKELEQRLMLETKEIKSKFNILINMFFDALEDRDFPVRRLERYIDDELGKLMKQPTNIEEVQCIRKIHHFMITTSGIHDQISWYGQ